MATISPFNGLRPNVVRVIRYLGQTLHQLAEATTPPCSCSVCGCTDDNCAGCILRTGEPCHWVGENLCSACAPDRHI